MITKLNPQFTIRNDENCSYLIKKNGAISSMVDKDVQSVTIIPPAIGYILSIIGTAEYEESVKSLSSMFCIDKNVIDSFVRRLLTGSSKRIKFNGYEVVLPKCLLVLSDTPSKVNDVNYSKCFKSVEMAYERPKAPINVNLMITTKCSTNCCYCYAKRKFDYELTLSEITNIIEECKKFGVVNLNLTGGDIFARTNWREILYAARKCNYNPFISTKTPIREEDVHYLNTLGITEMQFSLDSCDKSVLKGLIGVQSNYIEKVAEMFQFCQKYNIKLCIRTVLCNQNADISYVSGLYGFISKYNCIKDWVLTPAFFSEFKATYRFYEVTNSQLIAVRNFVERIHSIFPVYLSKISSCGYKLKQYQTINDYVLYNQKCFANSYSMSILASGECTICEMLYNNKEYLLGNIRHQSLLDIWNGEKALRLYAPIQSEMPKTSPCHSCSVFENCRRKLSKRVCYVDIAKINKSHSLGKPDPRCPKAQDIDVVL